jgi:hypothetical protein
MIAVHGGLAEGEALYELPLGSHRISTGDQGDAWAWDISRPLAEQLAETARDAMREVRACLHLANSDTPDADLMPDPCPKCGLYYMGDNSVEESRGRGFVGIDRSLAPTLVQYPPPRPLSVELIRDAAKVIEKAEGREPLSGIFDRAFPCNCKALREQHSSASGSLTSENCKLLGAETCTHDHMTEAETALSFGVDGELG